MSSQIQITDIRNKIDKIYTEEYIIHKKLIKNMEDIEELKIKHYKLFP